MGLLTGKTALITGAARGIGKAVAMKFAKEGANIAFTDLVLNDDIQPDLRLLARRLRRWALHAALMQETLLTSRRLKRP